jgi:hypothetical protein
MRTDPERNSEMKNEKLKIVVLFVLVFMIVWNLGDYLYCTFITGSGYLFTFGDSVIKPFITALLLCALYYFFPLRKKRR